MDKKKLMELAERYQHKADTAFQNYQETGITPVYECQYITKK